MNTIIVEKTVDFAVARYAPGTPMTLRVHSYTKRFDQKTAPERYQAFLDYCDSIPEEYANALMYEERSQSWEEEVECDHTETTWTSPGMMTCTSCGSEMAIACNESDNGQHEAYLAGPRTNEWRCRFCLSAMSPPQEL